MSLSGRLHDYGEGDNKSSDKKDLNFYWGLVVADASEDPFNAGRIKVRIRGVDDTVKANADLPWSAPMLPKFLNISPKKGETVKVFLANRKNRTIDRYFIGPVISQYQKLNNDPHFFTSRAGLPRGLAELASAIYIDPESKIENTNWQVFAKETDISLIGRGNQDIIIREGKFYDEIILRVGKHRVNNVKKLNKKNPTYISMVQLQTGVGKKLISEDRTHVNIVADQINLISHRGSLKGKPPAILNSDDAGKQILTENNKLHPTIYGDLFWELLNRLEAYIRGHIHEGGGVAATPPDYSGPTRELLEWIGQYKGSKVEKSGDESPNPDGSDYVKYDSPMLSNNVKIN
jgi:hypothetical protein